MNRLLQSEPERLDSRFGGDVRWGVVALALLAALSAGRSSSAQSSARFWISMSGDSTSGPEAPTIQRANDDVDTLYIWAQPAAGKTLQNFSLNIWAEPSSQPVVDFLDSDIVVYNPVLGGPKRFEEVHDSGSPQPLMSNRTAAEVAGGMTDGIGLSEPILRYGLQGYSIDSVNGTGIGSTCHPDDSFCVATPGGPAWLLASLPFQAVLPTGLESASASYHLQIGFTGMNYVGEDSSQLSAILGTGTGPTYTAVIEDREITKSGDAADLIVQVISTPPGDFNRDGRVDAADYTVWRDGLGPIYTLDDYNTWKTNFGQGAGSCASTDSSNIPSSPVPEPITSLLLGVGSVALFVCRRVRRSCVP